jgi:serine/threonine protein kinase
MTGQVLSHYRVLGTVGHGASGVIYKAEDLALGRLVALKCLPADLPASSSAFTRFQHEARAASAINHPNICTIHGIGEHDGRQFIVMEWLEGRTLANVIDRRPLKVENLVEYAIQIADGLNAAHLQGIVHRDLKPSNIVVTSNDQIKIVDFGVSLLLPPPGSQAYATGQDPVGTAPYMSPEQALGETLDCRSDLFSLGSVLYEMSTGCRPFVAGTVAEIAQSIVNDSPVPPRTINPNIPSDLDRIVIKALEKNRKLRFQTASDMRVDLQRLKRDFDSGTLHPTARIMRSPNGAQPSRPQRAWLKKGPVTAFGAAASLLLMIGAIAALTPKSPSQPVPDGAATQTDAPGQFNTTAAAVSQGRARTTDLILPAKEVEGELTITSVPPAAHVTVNGIARGQTPVRVRYLPAGPYVIRFVLAGYPISERRVTLSEKDPRVTVNATLRRSSE